MATGILSCDRWKSYQGLDGLQIAFCWAHVRRDFTDPVKSYPVLLGAWVDRIGMLYHLTAQRQDLEPGTDAMRLRAVRDALARQPGPAWDGLTLSLDHPEVPLDNNAAERLPRTSVVGRKNFYGSGSVSSGQLAECAYMVLLTAARNGLSPLTYLRAYLDTCAENVGNAPADIDRFLLWTAAPADRATWTLPPTAV